MRDNFILLDYASTDPIKNLKQIFLLMILILTFPLFIKLAELICFRSQAVRDTIERFKNKYIYWNMYLRFTLEFYLEIAISACITVRRFRYETGTEFVLTAYAMSLLMILTIATVGSATFIRTEYQRLDDDGKKENFDSLYLGLKSDKMKALLYPSVYMVRRLIFALVIVFLQNSTSLQICAIVCL